MAKKKKSIKRYKVSWTDDRLLMILAAAAAILVAFVAIFSYRSQSLMLLPTPTPDKMTVQLDSQNSSGESGTATLQEINGKVVVTLSLSGFPKGTAQPAHIHVGKCPNPGAIKYPLTSVVNGESKTTIDTTLSALQNLGDLAINVHKSVPQSNIYVACGNLK